jgi:hypothetical protein
VLVVLLAILSTTTQLHQQQQHRVNKDLYKIDNMSNMTMISLVWTGLESLTLFAWVMTAHHASQI